MHFTRCYRVPGGEELIAEQPLLPRLQSPHNLQDDLEQVAHDAVVRHVEDRGIGVGVDRDNHARKGVYGDAVVSDPRGPFGGKCRVGRGGSWMTPEMSLRGSDRSGMALPDAAYKDVGLRVALSF